MLKKINLIDEISNVDSKFVEKALEIDSKEKLIVERKKERSLKFNNLFKWGSVCLGCLCVVIVGVLMINNNDNKEELMQLPNPLTEVKSISEMKKYLGFNVPVIKDKKISSYIVIGEEKNATHARIVYEDNSSFEMEKGKNKDVSGIYGGELLETRTINNIKVEIYTMENIIYATWSDNEYSYSYSMEDGTVENLVSDIKKIK